MGWMLWCVCLSIGGGILLLLISIFYLGGIRSDYRGSFLKDRGSVSDDEGGGYGFFGYLRLERTKGRGKTY